MSKEKTIGDESNVEKLLKSNLKGNLENGAEPARSSAIKVVEKEDSKLSKAKLSNHPSILESGTKPSGYNSTFSVIEEDDAELDKEKSSSHTIITFENEDQQKDEVTEANKNDVESYHFLPPVEVNKNGVTPYHPLPLPETNPPQRGKNCKCVTKFDVFNDLDHLPVIVPRYHGRGCAFEVAVLERHEGTCVHKKCENPGRNILDDNCGSFEVVGRVVYPYCDRPCEAMKPSMKSYSLNEASTFGHSFIEDRHSVAAVPVLPACSHCSGIVPQVIQSHCCSESSIDCCVRENSAIIEKAISVHNYVGGNSTMYVKSTAYINPASRHSLITNIDDGACCPLQMREYKWSDFQKLPEFPTKCQCADKLEARYQKTIETTTNLGCASENILTPKTYPVQVNSHQKQAIAQLNNYLTTDKFMENLPEEKRIQVIKLRKFIKDAESAVKVSKSKKNFALKNVYHMYPVSKGQNNPNSSTYVPKQSSKTTVHPQKKPSNSTKIIKDNETPKKQPLSKETIRNRSSPDQQMKKEEEQTDKVTTPSHFSLHENKSTKSVTFSEYGSDSVQVEIKEYLKDDASSEEETIEDNDSNDGTSSSLGSKLFSLFGKQKKFLPTESEEFQNYIKKTNAMLYEEKKRSERESIEKLKKEKD